MLGRLRRAWAAFWAEPAEEEAEFVRSLLAGLKDRKEGRMVPLSEIKEEFDA